MRKVRFEIRAHVVEAGEGEEMSKFSKFTDNELREELKAIDERDVEVTDWEARFIQSIVFGSFSNKKLKPGQREAAEKICGDYEK